jgi:hypothetical protein
MFDLIRDNCENIIGKYIVDMLNYHWPFLDDFDRSRSKIL